MVRETDSLNTWCFKLFKFQVRGQGKCHPCDNINSYKFLDQGSGQLENQSLSLPHGQTALSFTHGSHVRCWAWTQPSSFKISAHTPFLLGDGVPISKTQSELPLVSRRSRSLTSLDRNWAPCAVLPGHYYHPHCGPSPHRALQSRAWLEGRHLGSVGSVTFQLWVLRYIS